MKVPLVSCIITNYNGSNFLSKSIESVLNQSYNNIELIIVDDFSNDNSFKILNYYQKEHNKIKIIYHKKNLGLPSISRNTGIKKSKGKYIAFLDSDDFWAPNKIEIQVNYFEKNVDCVAVGSNAKLIGDINNYKQIDSIQTKKLYFNHIYSLKNVGLSSLVIKNTGILFDESPKYRYVEDLAIQLSITKNKSKFIKVVDQKLFFYRIHPSSGSLNKKFLFNIFHVLNDFKKNVSFLAYLKSTSKANSIISVKFSHNFSYAGFYYALKSIVYYPIEIFNYKVLLLAACPNILKKFFFQFNSKIN